MLVVIITLVFLLAVYCLWSGGIAGLASDPGLGWHIKTGQYILHYGSVPHSDPFLAIPASLSSARSWICDQWLSDIFLALGWQTGGWPTLYVATFFLFTFSFLIIPTAIGKTLRLNPLAVIIAAFLGSKMAGVQLLIRPVQCSFLLFAVLLWILYREKRRELLMLPLLFLLWANLHPGFVMGLMVVTIWSVEQSIRQKKADQLLLGMLCVIATLITPFGLALYQSFFALGTSKYFMSLHQEWRALSFLAPEGEFFLYASVLAMLGIWKSGTTRVWPVVALVIVGAWSVASVRVLPYYAILAVPLVATGLQLFPLSFFKAASDARHIAALQITVVFSLALLTSFFPQILFQGSPVGPKPSFYPTAAVAWLDQECAALEKPCTVASLSDWGGYLTFAGENLRPIIDDRNTLVGEEWYRQSAGWIEECQDLNALQKEFPETYLLLPRPVVKICLKKSPGLKILFEDNLSVVAKLPDDRSPVSQ